MKKKLYILFLLFAVILTSGFGCTPDPTKVASMKPITLQYWRVWEGPDAMHEIINRYNAMHPNVTIQYRKLRYDEYEDALIKAFATDRGPDIFSVHNTWVRKYKTANFLAPMPAKIEMGFPVVKGTIKKDVVIETRTRISLRPQDIDAQFVDVVYGDSVIASRDPATGQPLTEIYALPYYMDTLALLYNKDLFNNADIIFPPSFWNREFQQSVKKLTKQDTKGEIIQSGVALGGAENIERYTDIVSVLMMQNGTTMQGDAGNVMFHTKPEAFKDKVSVPGVEALRFYTDFANPGKEVYSWNKTLNNSLDMFIDGKLAMIFGYSYHVPIIKARAPKLNFRISKLPQIDGNAKQINYANYWTEVVSKKSIASDVAWDFIQFAASPDIVRSYLATVKKPTALKALIAEQLEDPEIGVFAEQVLTAQSWYKGNDAILTEKIMGEMVEKAIAGQGSLEAIIGNAASKVQQTINKGF